MNAYRALTEWGTVTSDTTWGAVAGMPDTMYVAGDLTIDTGVTLTINPGTVVRIAPEDIENDGDDTTRVQIVVKGTLRTGTGSGQVVFESFNDDPGDDDWLGIRFESTSRNNVLEDVVIRSAVWGITSYADVTLRRCDIEADDSGILFYGGGTAEDCVISAGNHSILAGEGTVTLLRDTISGGNNGIDVGASLDEDPAGVTIEDCYIHDVSVNGVVAVLADDTVRVVDTRIENAYWGVTVGPVNGEITGCTLKHNDSGAVALGSVTPNVPISECLIDSNATNGIYCGNVLGNVIEGNTISNNTVGIQCTSAGSPTIKNGNTIEDNSTGIKCDSNSDPAIENGNLIDGNSIGIRCDGNSDPYVEWNVISSNAIGVAVLNGSDPDLGDLSGGSIGNNSFLSSSSYHVSNLEPSVTVKADSNWWGSASGPHPTKINGAVDYTPWKTVAPGDPPSLVAQLPVPESPSLPDRFQIAAVYPNPFNPVTTIRYAVPSPGGQVHVAVYDIRGALVSTLVNRHAPPGYHSVNWAGRNEHGQPVASGVYFLRLSAERHNETRKIVLLK